MRRGWAKMRGEDGRESRGGVSRDTFIPTGGGGRLGSLKGKVGSGGKERGGEKEGSWSRGRGSKEGESVVGGVEGEK